METVIEESIKEQERKLLELQKSELTKSIERFRYSWKGFLITFLIGFIAFTIIILSTDLPSYDNNAEAVFVSLGMALALEIYYLLIWGIIRMVYTNRLSSVLLKLANFESKEIQLNFKYLDKYYLQTQIQADKSFGLCLFAALFAIVIIAIGIVLMFLSAYDKNMIPGDSAKISSYIVTASGVLSEFIAAVFFYLYNQTILKMSEYHQKLVLTQNISLAL